ncbi:MAG: 30S ribosomal protein S3 [Slackia sp.]
MGQKIMPTGFRLGITEDWRSRWYSDKDYAKNLENDLAIRRFLDKHLAKAAVSKVEIERAGDKVKIIITTARPGVVIGKKGAEIESLRKQLAKVVGAPVNIEVVEVKRPELDANLIAQSVAEQLEGRGCVPSCHAQGRPVCPQVRRPGHPSVLRLVWAAPR